MTTKSVSLNQPTDYGAEAERIARQRKMAEILQQESMQQGPAGQMVGNTFIPQHWTSGLAKALQGASARGWQTRSDEEAKNLAGQRRADTSADMSSLIRALQGTPGGSETIVDEQANGGMGAPAQINVPGVSQIDSLRAALPNMRTPEMQQAGFGILQQQLKPKELFSKVDAKDYTPESVARFAQTNNYSDLVPVRKREIVSLGGTSQAVDPYAVTPGQTLAHTITPEATLSDQRVRSEGALNRGVSVRGQNMTDSRAREVLDAGRWTNDLERGVQVNTATGETRPITTGGAPVGQREKPLTESQAKASVYHSQMVGASEELGKITGYDPNSGMTQADTAVAGGRGNMIASESAQRAKQAQSQWAESFLRFKTGAASTPAEVALNVATFFPQVGDKPGVVEQKARMRTQAERDIAMAAGRSAGRRSTDAPAVDDPLGLRK